MHGSRYNQTAGNKRSLQTTDYGHQCLEWGEQSLLWTSISPTGPTSHCCLFQMIPFKCNLAEINKKEISGTSAVPAAAFPELSSHELPVASDVDSDVLKVFPLSWMILPLPLDPD